jgi:uncharacterized membrane protein
MGDTIVILMFVVLVMVVCGETGYRIAKTQNRNPIIGFVLGAAFPLVGIGLMMLVQPKLKRQRG